MIVSAATLSGQALASDIGGAVVECRNPNRHPPTTEVPPQLSDTQPPWSTSEPRSLISEEPLNSSSHCASHNLALVIHVAAQAFVRRSYAEPFEDVGFGIGRRVRSAN